MFMNLKPPRWMLIVFGLVASGILLAAVVLPLIVKHRAVAWVASHTSRTLTIESLRFNPLTLGVTLRGVSLSEPDRPTIPFVAFERLETALSLRSLVDRAVILRKVHLSDPRILLIRTADHTYNFADLQALGQQGTDKKRAAKQSEPLHFSVNNITIVDGRIDFFDRVLPAEKHHTISELNVGIPFIGNIPYLTDLYVTPTLRAKVNDAPCTFEGKLKPFRDGAETSVDVTLNALDLAIYIPYLPTTLPLKVQSGHLDSRISVIYRVAKDQKPEAILSGDVHLADFAANGIDGQPLIAVHDVWVALLPSRPLVGDLQFDRIDIGQPQLAVHRNRRGAWNLPGLDAKPTPRESAPAPDKTSISKSEPLRLRLNSLRLTGGEVDFHDELPAGGFRTRIAQLDTTVTNFDSTSSNTATLALAFTTPRQETCAVSGGFALKPVSANLDVKLEHLALAGYYPYLQTQLTAPVSGLLTLQIKAQYDHQAGPRISDGQLLIEELFIPLRGGESLSLPRLHVGGIRADLNRQLYHVEEATLDQGRINLTRFSDGRWSPLELLRAPTAAPSAGARTTERNTAQPQFTLGHLRLNNWRGAFTDDTVGTKLVLAGVNLNIDDFSYPQLTLTRASLGGRLGAGRMQLEAGGRLQPLSLTGRVQFKQFPLPELWAYVPPQVRILLVTGDFDADLRFRVDRSRPQLAGYCRGSLGLGNFYLVNSDDAEDLLRWENLSLDRVDASLDQNRLTVAEIALSGLISQVSISPDGTVNFKKVVAAQEPASPSATMVSPQDEPQPATAPSSLPPPAEPPQPWTVAIQQVTLQNGRIDFADRHMSPPFRAVMVNLGGRISGLSTSPEMLADVDVRGTLDNRSPLQISGVMNPLSKTPRVDLTMTFGDIELSPVSPYSGRYLGYTVDKGKLFLDLKYQVENQQLKADNKVFLDQFTFGSSVDSPDAVHLPVKLAVALLKDRKGEIHLDVPLTGRIDDPEFSLWRIILQVLKNLLIKAATSPFSLLASLGGGEEFTAVQFAPGSDQLSDADRANLAKLATALADRPALKLQLTGFAEAAVDEEPYRRRLLEQRIQRAKFLELARNKAVTVGQTAESVTVTPEERSGYLKEVYRKADFPKPRNVLGLLKSLPDEEMEKLILAHTVIGSEQLSELAWARSTAVMNELVGKNGLPAARLFQNNIEIARPEGKPAEWRGNRVEFGVAVD